MKVQIPGVRDAPTGDVDAVFNDAPVVIEHIDPLIVVSLGRRAATAVEGDVQRIPSVFIRLADGIHEKTHGLPGVSQHIKLPILGCIIHRRHGFTHPGDLGIQRRL